MGLSWHRAGRSISVRDWLNKLNTGRAAGPLRPAHDLQSAPANPRPARPFTATALFAVLLICVTVWVSVAGLAGRKISSNDVVPAAAASEQLNTGPVPARESGAASGFGGNECCSAECGRTQYAVADFGDAIASRK
jgi:hypothetical protein